MNKLKKGRMEKGITLIALIITIIVLLILAIVTIGAIKNDGLIQYAQNARKDYTDASNKEQEALNALFDKIGLSVSNKEDGSGTEVVDNLELIKTYFLGEVDGTTGKRPGINMMSEETVIAEPALSEVLYVELNKIKFKNNDIISNAYDNMSVVLIGEEGENGYTYVKYNGGIYKVTFSMDFLTKDVTIVEESTILDEFEKYILGSEGNGRIVFAIDENDNFVEKIWDLQNSELLDDSKTYNIDEKGMFGAKVLTLGYAEKNDVFMYVKYNNKAYRIVCELSATNGTLIFSTKRMELVYEPKGREGQKTAEGWTILYDNITTVEAVSPESMGSLRLGYSENSIDLGTALSEAIDSYNNAITTINNYCKSLKGLPENINVRSVGAEKEITTDRYTHDGLGEYNGVGLYGDLSFEQDLVRMAYWGVHALDGEYWLASRVMDENNVALIYFGIRNVESNGNLSGQTLWSIDIDAEKDKVDYEYDYTCGVRPIITIENK